MGGGGGTGNGHSPVTTCNTPVRPNSPSLWGISGQRTLSFLIPHGLHTGMMTRQGPLPATNTQLPPHPPPHTHPETLKQDPILPDALL